MARIATIFVTILATGLFAWAIPLDCLFRALQPLTVALSIMIAAVFVRLNRGMPALEWKSLDPKKRKDLTASIVNVTLEYGWIIGMNTFALVGLVALSVIGATETILWPKGVSQAVSGMVGFLITLCIARMAYVVWRDIDIVRLQKHLIDEAASREIDDREHFIADEKVAGIKAANIRPVEVRPPSSWR